MVQRVSEKISELDLASAPSAELYLPVVTGSTTVRMTKQAFLGGTYDVRASGAVSGVNTSVQATLNTTAIQASIDAAALGGGGSVFVPVGEFYVRKVTLKSNVRLLGTSGSKLKLFAGVNDHVVSIQDASSHVAVIGLEIDGNKASNTGGHGVAGPLAGTLNHLEVSGCYIHDCGVDGIRPGGTVENFIAHSNLLENNGTFAGGGSGLSADVVSHFSFVGNIARLNYSHGIGVIGIATYGAIIGNECHDNGQANPVGPTADGITGYNLANRHVTITGNTCSGGNNHGIHWGGENITISGNTIYDVLQTGIVVSSSSSGVTRNVVVSGNSIRDTGAHGIWMDRVDGFSVSGNSVDTATNHGIWLDSSDVDGTVSGNVVKDCGTNGIRLQAATRVKLDGNVVTGNGSTGIRLTSCVDCSLTGNDSTMHSAGSSQGILLVDTTGTWVSGNRCKGNKVTVQETGTTDSSVYEGNHFTGNTDDTPYLVGAANRWRNNENGGTSVVASAAALPAIVYTDTWSVSGVATITSIVGGNWRDRIITLVFQGALTFTDGSNLKLAGNFVTTADDSITLRGDGTNWTEMSRSAN